MHFTAIIIAASALASSAFAIPTEQVSAQDVCSYTVQWVGSPPPAHRHCHQTGYVQHPKFVIRAINDIPYDVCQLNCQGTPKCGYNAWRAGPDGKNGLCEMFPGTMDGFRMDAMTGQIFTKKECTKLVEICE